MGKLYFTQKQVAELRKNPFVKNVSEKSITYKEEFKELFYQKYLSGETPRQIFKDCGFDPNILGTSRIYGFAERVKKYGNRQDGFVDTRSFKSGRPDEGKATIEEKLAISEYNNKILRQEIDFLKRVRSINKKQIQKRSYKKQQETNSH